MEQILYGAPVAAQLDKISKNIFQEYTNKNKKPHLTAITVGDNPASLLYVSRKQEKALELGVEFNWIKLSENTSQDDLSEIISSESKDTDGIIIQLPLPDHLPAGDPAGGAVRVSVLHLLASPKDPGNYRSGRPEHAR